jgi:sugar lactone lactonase YvrE
LAVLATGGMNTGRLQAQLVGPAPPAVQFDPRIVTVAGGGAASQFGGDGGPALSASMYNPQGMALDKFGNLYIADTYNCVVRRIDAQTQIITTVAGQKYYHSASPPRPDQ